MKTNRILSFIAAKAKVRRKEKFTSLAHLLNEEMFKECFGTLKRNRATGIDGVTVDAYGENLDANLASLVTRMKSKEWRPQAARRVYIPKPGKTEKRPLAIPSTEDKLVQEGVKRILESIYEHDFLDVSHGFRPSRSCHTAIRALDECLMKRPVNFIVEVDIRNFFGEVSHHWLLRCLEERIADPNFLWVIRRLLKAGVMEDKVSLSAEQGTPQGGIASPLLANIYLHFVLDLWFEREFKRTSRNFMQLIRYCDDFVVAFESRKDAEQFLTSLETRFAKFGLKTAPEKTRLIEFGRNAYKRSKKNGVRRASFNFLGFTHFMSTSRRGYVVPGHKTSKENLRRKLREMKEWLKSMRTVRLSDWRATLNAKLTGHYNYFGLSGNYRCIRQFYFRTVHMMLKWLNRRSQKKSFEWESFSEYLQKNPLPQPRIFHRLYDLKPAL